MPGPTTQAGRPHRPSDPDAAAVWDVAATVADPEIPVLTVADLGVLRSAALEVTSSGHGPRRTAYVEITPTYSGCPAMETFRADIVAALLAAGYDAARVDVVLAPAWTTDWMSAEGRDKLRRYGIAPPTGAAPAGPREPGAPIPVRLSVRCPHCGSLDTREQTRFASTSCKALYACNACLEPFDYFKVL